jgi:hypothetical protein
MGKTKLVNKLSQKTKMIRLKALEKNPKYLEYLEDWRDSMRHSLSSQFGDPDRKIPFGSEIENTLRVIEP